MNDIGIVGYVFYPTMILLCSCYDSAIGLLLLSIGARLFAYRCKVASELLVPCAILTCTAFTTSFTRIRLLFVCFR